MPKKPDFGAELDTKDTLPRVPAPDFETVYGGLKLPTAAVIIESLQFSKTGLIIDRELTQGEWLELRKTIQTIKQAYQWIVGDWMLYGFEREWSTTYEDMAALTGLKEKTVKEYTSICRNIPASIRMDKLSFGHFQLIATVPNEDKPGWIQRAIDEKMSVRDLYKAIHSEDPDPPPPLSNNEIKLLSHFVRAIKQNRLSEISSDEIVYMRKALERAGQLLKR